MVGYKRQVSWPVQDVTGAAMSRASGGLRWTACIAEAVWYHQNASMERHVGSHASFRTTMLLLLTSAVD